MKKYAAPFVESDPRAVAVSPAEMMSAFLKTCSTVLEGSLAHLFRGAMLLL